MAGVTVPGTVDEPLYLRIAANIRAEILDGRLAPGQHLREQSLARRYGVSRVPVREAIRRLEAERLVEVRPNAGALVTTVDAEEARELLRVRLVLEELIVAEAATRRRPADVEELAAIVEAGRRSVRGARPSELVALNTAFHEALGRASGNRTATGLVEQLRTRIELVYADRLPTRARDSWEEHAAILDAVAAGDPGAAAARLRDHIEAAAGAFGPAGAAGEHVAGV